jgi:hypothetical protein
MIERKETFCLVHKHRKPCPNQRLLTTTKHCLLHISPILCEIHQNHTQKDVLRCVGNPSGPLTRKQRNDNILLLLELFEHTGLFYSLLIDTPCLWKILQRGCMRQINKLKIFILFMVFHKQFSKVASFLK